MYAEQAAKLCEPFGAADQELAQFFCVSESTINHWKIKHPEFLAAILPAKAEADSKVAHALYLHAIGYEHPEDNIFCNGQGIVTVELAPKHHPPDTAACIFWLKNRQPDK